MEMKYLVAAVRAHAIANYNKGGWDYIVECWEDEDIEKEIVGCRKPAGAIKKVGQCAKALGDYRDEVRAEVW
jgi:hypothetical protein